MNKRDDRLIVEFDKDFVECISEWKKRCLGLYGRGGIKQRATEIIKEDLKKLRLSK